MVTLYAWKVPLLAHVQQERHPTEDPLLQVSRYKFWVNYNDLTTTEPWKIMVSKGKYPQMALIQISELL